MCFPSKIDAELLFGTRVNCLGSSRGRILLMQFVCKKIVVERRVSLAFERGFHADVTVNNVKHRRSPFYFVHTFLLPGKDDFLPRN